MQGDLTDGRVYRTFWARFWAGLVDGLVFLPLSWVDPWVWAAVTNPALLVTWFVLHSVCMVTYTILLHGFFGQTLGKRLTGVKVLDVSGSHISMRQAVLRDSVFLVLIVYGLVIDLPSVASGVNPYAYDPETIRMSDLGMERMLVFYAAMLWFVLELATMLSNRKRRALHDFIAGSVVVRLDRWVPPPRQSNEGV